MSISAERLKKLLTEKIISERQEFDTSRAHMLKVVRHDGFREVWSSGPIAMTLVGVIGDERAFYFQFAAGGITTPDERIQFSLSECKDGVAGFASWLSAALDSIEAKEEASVTKMTLEEFINKSWEPLPGSTPVMSLNGPVNLTVKDTAGRYRKKNFIGEEVMIPHSCYLGKRKKLILVFRQEGASDLVEMSQTEAESFLGNFKTHFTALVMQYEDQHIAAIRATATATEGAADTHARRLAEDPLFGSW